MNDPDIFDLPTGKPVVSRQRIKVLSLSGGGYRGLFTAQVIHRLEAELQTASGGQSLTPFGQNFDLIAGTSIGGILAAGLSCGVTGAQLVKALKDSGQRIFPPLRFRALRKLLGRPPYSPEPLRATILALMPDAASRKLAQHKPGLLLTTVNWTSSKLQLLGSAGTTEVDGLGLSLMDAMLATSAAPAHFPPHRVSHHAFVDGGLAANAPDLLALQVARDMWPGADIHMLSIGTANPLHGRDPSNLPERGLTWAKPVMELVMNAQEMRAVQECAKLLGNHRYLRLNMAPSALQVRKMDFDVADAVSTQLLMNL
ncbi:MAG: CBASS cGAMP-activated phospholipase, partial [Polaromonas sp.]